ncbi:hypothetical protein ES708_07606 [subsurface metagenome]
MNSDFLNNKNFEKGLADYFYLIDRNYPEKGALKLVGDRYRLTTVFRTILYRGVSSSESSLKRMNRLVDIPSEELIIDGYNILFTLLNYRLGRFVFISTDSLCRDAGSLFGKIRNEKLFNECLSVLIEYLADFKDVVLTIYLDAPVSFSRNHKYQIEELLKYNKLEGKVHVVRSADMKIKEHTSGLFATVTSQGDFLKEHSYALKYHVEC